MMRRGLIIAAFVALVAVAVAGWVRKPAPAFAQTPYQSAYNQTSATPYPYGQSAYNQAAPGVWDAQAMQAGYANPCGPAVTPAYYYPSQAPAYRSVVYRRYTPTSTRRVVRNRPFSHSAAIVAGSAGVGAAIGALAGGGKGAGIGALSGGAAGFIYDRLTHRRVSYQ